MSKLIFKITQDDTTEPGSQSIRKRLHRSNSDDTQSKKLRAQLENIELSSSGSSISSSDLEGIISDTDLTATSTSSSSIHEEEDVKKTVLAVDEDIDVIMEVQSNSSKISIETAEQTKPKIIHVECLPNVYLRQGSNSVENVEITEGNNTKEVSKENNVFQLSPVVRPQSDSPKPSTSTCTRTSSTSSPSKIVISDSSSDEEETNSNKQQESPNFTYTSAYAFAGNNVNGQSQFTRTSFSDSSNRYTRNQSRRQEKQQDKYNRRAQHAENSYFKAQQRSEEYQRMQRERAEEQQRRSQEYVRRAQEQASRFTRRISTATASPYQGFIANIQDSVEQTLRSTRNTLFRVADINQKVFNGFN